jgi:hypothetical protein
MSNLSYTRGDQSTNGIPASGRGMTPVWYVVLSVRIRALIGRWIKAMEWVQRRCTGRRSEA